MRTPEQTKRIEALDGLAEAFRARAPQYDRDAAFPEENFRDLHTAGILSLTLPVKWGGQGLWGDEGFVEYYEVLEHLASIDPPTGQLLQVHLHAIGMLAHAATEEQARKYLIPIVEAGRRVASVGSESVPGKKGAGASSSELTRLPDGNWSLTCEKHFASLGPGADHFIIWLAVPGTEDYDHRSVAVLVDRHAPEVEMIDNWDTLGMRATVSQGVRITGMTIPADAVFGAPGWWETHDPRTFTLGFASNHLGSARGALRFATEWVRDRPNLAGSELIQFQLGEMSANLFAAREGLFAAARLWEGDDAAAAEYASVQALTVAKRVSLEITQRALDVCGARSMFKSYQLEQIYRDTRTFTLHYRVDNYTRELGAAMIADGYAVKGNGGITAITN
ncbi:SfnB family sulfur acquisition oxidoreductase [Actinocorallia aurea]